MATPKCAPPLPLPPAPVTDTLPPPDVIVPLAKTSTPTQLEALEPLLLPPDPVTVTVPMPPAVIRPPASTWTPLLTSPLPLPPAPVTDTLPPPEDIVEPLPST